MTQSRLNAAFVIASTAAFVLMLTWAGYFVAPARTPAVVVTR